MEDAIAELAAQQAELSAVLQRLTPAEWHAATRCDGWDVADVVLHLAQTNELAIGSLGGRFSVVVAQLTDGVGPATSVDQGAARMVERERGPDPAHLLGRWSSGAARLLGVLENMDLSTRVQWVAGELSARTLATTRLAETWIHTGDVADAVGVGLAPTERLRPIARLAWRTLPYAFASAGRAMSGPVAFLLTSPGGVAWDFVPEGAAHTTISGPAVELCAVAARRLDASATSLHAEGPDGDAVLSLVRTYA